LTCALPPTAALPPAAGPIRHAPHPHPPASVTATGEGKTQRPGLPGPFKLICALPPDGRGDGAVAGVGGPGPCWRAGCRS
jgi:hypothetical protein